MLCPKPGHDIRSNAEFSVFDQSGVGLVRYCDREPLSSNSYPEISVLSGMSKRETRYRAAGSRPVSGTGRVVGEGKREISSVGIPQLADRKLVQPQDPTIFKGYRCLSPYGVAAFLRIGVARIDRELADFSKIRRYRQALFPAV